VSFLNQSKGNLLRFGNIAAFIVTLVINGLASTTVLNGRSTAQVSNLYTSMITPAGYVFAIWGVIYALLAVFIIYQTLPSQKSKQFQKQISGLFILSSFFNCLWLFLWQYNYIPLSVAPILALLATLIAIYLRLGIGNAKVPLREKLCVHLAFSVYFGWITVATLADIAAALVYEQWNGLSPNVWAEILLLVALAVTLIVIAFRRDIAYSLVIIWALVGIAVNHSANQNIVTTVEAAVAVIVVALVLSILIHKSRRKNMPDK
jgi:hypothetical protein